MSHHSVTSGMKSLVATATVLVFAVACSELAGPEDSSGGDISASGGSLTDPHVTVCVDAGSPAGTYEYDQSASTSNGTFLTTAPFSLSPGNCVDVWQDDDETSPNDPSTDVTITEMATASGAALDNIDISGNAISSSTSGSSATVTVNHFHGATITFEHVAVGGGQGCTPGYWKQSQHFDSWPPKYSPAEGSNATELNDVFTGAVGLNLERPESGTAGDLTLLQGLELRGGGVNALIRHAVAALLNAANGDVSYDLTEQEVIDAFNAAVDGGDVEGTKDDFEGFNEQGCPLD